MIYSYRTGHDNTRACDLQEVSQKIAIVLYFGAFQMIKIQKFSSTMVKISDNPKKKKIKLFILRVQLVLACSNSSHGRSSPGYIGIVQLT